jgi:integrase
MSSVMFNADSGPQPSSRRRDKKVPPRQSAIDALPFNSGTWRVEGSMGLYVRCRAQSKSFLVQRKIGGRVVQKVIGPMSLAEARREAQRIWASLKPAPIDDRLTLSQAWSRYLDEKPLREATQRLYRYNFKAYLSSWGGRTLEEIGNDRAGVRTLYQSIRKNHGDATAAQVKQMLSAVYRYFRKVNPDLPPTPTEVITTAPKKSRDWALSDDELRAWWQAVQRLRPIKRVMWLTLLLTGARAASVQYLRWSDVDLERGVIRFAVAKGGRSYSVAASRRLIDVLQRWKRQCPPTAEGWVFPSPVLEGQPITTVRDDKRGVVSAHHLRHTMRTRLVEVGATPDLARIALGHSLMADVSQRYITASLLVEATRPLMEAVAEAYARILAWEDEDLVGAE